MIDVFWKIAHKLYKHGFKKFARFFELISMVISSHAVSAQIEIGEKSKFYHHALGCVALQSVHIGRNCKIFQNVTFGNSFSDRNNSLPHQGEKITKFEYCYVGDNCLIGAGAVLLGNIRIGNNVTIGANAVVTHDIPDNCIAKGVPARYEIKQNL